MNTIIDFTDFTATHWPIAPTCKVDEPLHSIGDMLAEAVNHGEVDADEALTAYERTFAARARVSGRRPCGARGVRVDVARKLEDFDLGASRAADPEARMDVMVFRNGTTIRRQGTPGAYRWRVTDGPYAAMFAEVYALEDE